MLTEKQLKARKMGIGGSDIGAICGYNQYKTPLDVYLDKTDLHFKLEQNDRMTWGNLDEPAVATMYAMKTNKKIMEVDTQIFAKYPWAFANIDRLIDDNGILECKITERENARFWGEPGTDQIPDMYLAQVAWYAHIMDAPYVDIAVRIGLYDFRIYTYKRIPAFEEHLLKKGKEFWENHVIPRIPPAITNLHDAANSYKLNSISSPISADTDTYLIVKRYNELKAEIRQKQSVADGYKLNIIESMKNHDTLTDAHGGIIATYKTSKVNRLNHNLVKSLLTEEQYEACKSESETRTFLTRTIEIE